jgi:hypothetical protein
MYNKTYRGVSRLATNYFKLLCGVQNLHDGYVVEEEEDMPGKGSTYSITTRCKETYKILQKVFEVANL